MREGISRWEGERGGGRDRDEVGDGRDEGGRKASALRQHIIRSRKIEEQVLMRLVHCAVLHLMLAHRGISHWVRE